jgi:hypothetical protein
MNISSEFTTQFLSKSYCKHGRMHVVALVIPQDTYDENGNPDELSAYTNPCNAVPWATVNDTCNINCSMLPVRLAWKNHEASTWVGPNCFTEAVFCTTPALPPARYESQESGLTGGKLFPRGSNSC